MNYKAKNILFSLSISKLRLFGFALAFLYSSLSLAQLLNQGVTSVRALGMGNAYAPIVEDADALFYNPAGLATAAFRVTLADPKAGVSNIETIDDLQDLQDDDTFSAAIRNLYGENIWAGAGAKAALQLPYFAGAIYDNLDVSLSINNPAVPELEVDAINDFGYAVGVGFPIIPLFLSGGISLKKITRTGDRTSYGPSVIGNLDPDTIIEDLEKEGDGYAMDVGLNLSIPGPASVIFSAVVRNVGDTKFTASDTTVGAPPKDEQELSLGVGLDFDVGIVALRPVLEYRYMTDTDVQYGKKVNIGVELDLPLIDLRAGFHQGYYTAGFSLGLGLIRIDAATYGVELGAYPGQLEDRRYVVQAALELGFSGGSFGFSDGDSSNGRSSARGRRGIKQRR